MTKQFGLSIILITASIIAIAQSSSLNRPFDPVVIQGSNLPAYSNLLPNQIVGFKYVNNIFIQIPIQVDERAVLDIVTPYGPYAADKGYPPPTGVNALFYTDAGTYTGADINQLFDADDELVFMVKDAGGKFSGTTVPSGVTSGTCTEIILSDPLGGLGYVYLFQNDGSLRQDAGVSYVTYTFQLANNGTYPQNFIFLGARNNENSTVTTNNYSWHFAAEWISDELKIKTGGATNIDILDRHKSFFFGQLRTF